MVDGRLGDALVGAITARQRRAMMAVLSASGPVRTTCLPAASVRCFEPVSPVLKQPVRLLHSATARATGSVAEHDRHRRLPVAGRYALRPLTADS